MRLAAQMKGGFYPASQEAVSLAATFLRPPALGPFAILDPCAGEGAAIRQLRDLLGCQPSLTYAIELDESRAKTLHAALPDTKVLAPASFFGSYATRNSFSFIWLNPPFDTSYETHRVEERFLHDATELLLPGGVIALVCPEDVMGEYSDTRAHFARHYENCKVVPFPEGHRPFNEVMIFGVKRSDVSAEYCAWSDDAWQAVQAPQGFVYHIPSGLGPRHFQKVEPTPVEIQSMLARSPLRAHLTAPPIMSIPAPPLALGMGHVALLLASGHLDGIVQGEGERPHVVRGTCRKHEFVSDVSETENDDGTTTTRTTLSERVELVVRTVDVIGNLHTYENAEEPNIEKKTPRFRT
jgi:hypothetical protein